jgi:hypothetical protein
MICSSENLLRFIACLLSQGTGQPQNEDSSGVQVKPIEKVGSGGGI